MQSLPPSTTCIWTGRKAIARPLGGEAFDDLGAFIAAVDLVSVTTPATTHAAIASAALKAGRHAYVEKPLATTVEDAEGLLELAAKRKLVLAVGHQERMVFRAMGLFNSRQSARSILRRCARGPGALATPMSPACLT